METLCDRFAKKRKDIETDAAIKLHLLKTTINVIRVALDWKSKSSR